MTESELIPSAELLLKKEVVDCLYTEEESHLLPVNVEIEEDPLSETATTWENLQDNGKHAMHPTSIQFRSYNKLYQQTLNGPPVIKVTHNGQGKLDFNWSSVSKKSTTDKKFEQQMKKQEEADGKLYTCSYCMKYFEEKKKLMEHLKLHIVNMLYQCNVCQMAFTEHSSLVSHREAHMVEDKYLCLNCQKATPDKLSKTAPKDAPHECNASGNHLIKPFDRVSNKRFLLGYQPSSEKKHPYHHRLTCVICDKKFTVLSDLTKHLRVHTGERPFVCQLCLKGFKQSSALTSHFRTHTGERPYVCHICCKAFTQSSALNTHTKVHTDSPLHISNPPWNENGDTIGDLPFYKNV